jgi:segregation and condensation protein A
MPSSDEYKVQLDIFEGPLDLLLYLIKKDEVDIHDIPIERITGQFMEYLGLMRMLDLDFAGEFLVMAATLMMIKSRMLLPVDERSELEEEEDDPRWDLVRQLVEYKKFKDAAQHLQLREMEQEDVFVRDGDGVVLAPDNDVALKDVSIFDLISAFNQALSRVKTEELAEIFSDQYTVPEKIDSILSMLETRDALSFVELVGSVSSKHELVCIFLAILELMRLKQLRATQKDRFGDIMIVKMET